MFHFPAPFGYPPFAPEAILSDMKSAITNKLKFVFCDRSCDVRPRSETLLATYSLWPPRVLKKMIPEIFNKRWQTVDLKSMMSELQRTSSEFMITKDTLSSVHRFKRKEGASLS